MVNLKRYSIDNKVNYEPTLQKLWRSRKNRKIAGVCGGLGEYFSVDPVWMRLLFVIFFLAGGAAFIAYVILWLIIPVEPEGWRDV